MTPVFGLHTTVWACAAVVVLGLGLVMWSIAPDKVRMRNLRFSLLLPVTTVGLLAFWSAFLRFPPAVMAVVMVVGGMPVHDLRYWILLLLGLAADAMATLWCFREAVSEAWELWRHNVSQLS